MSVSCPNCRTLIEDDGAGVCPACHHRLHEDPNEGALSESRWCESCGSPIPNGLDVCPECGMPVQGAFDDNRERFSVRASSFLPREQEDGSAQLKSAIPPTPKEGEVLLSADERRRRERLILVAALAALILVGGTTLYIARPWDPNAYNTHAMEDADTSMEGFPGEKTHLSSQDRTEEEEYKAELEQMDAALDSAYARIGEVAGKVSQSRDVLVAYTEGRQLSEDDATEFGTAQMKQDLGDIRAELDDLGLEDQSQIDRREKLFVLIDYLDGAIDVLANAWSAQSSNSTSPGSRSYVGSILKGSVGVRGFDEWYELFSNAYES